MIIQSSSIALESQNSAYSQYEKTEQLAVGAAPAGTSGNQGIGLSISKTIVQAQSSSSTLVQFSQQNSDSPLKQMAAQMAKMLSQPSSANAQPSSAPVTNQNTDDPFSMSLKDKLKLLLLMQLLGRFQKDPKLMKALGLDQLGLSVPSAQIGPSNTTADQASTSKTNNTPPDITYSSHESLYQSQTAQFSAQGEVKTSDGKTIDISIDLTMSRQTLETSDTSTRLAAATKDPLVINLDASAAQFSTQRFSFDLTANGQKDLIPQLQGNRAFLALDKNNDGVINNGTELFGARSGDGFGDLAKYDTDKNGWIDEKDAVFNDLKLWENAGTSQQKLVDLKTAGIGAIYTGSTKTSFQLQDNQGSHESLGAVQATGVYLKEDGSAGTIQHVDLTI